MLAGSVGSLRLGICGLLWWIPQICWYWLHSRRIIWVNKMERVVLWWVVACRLRLVLEWMIRRMGNSIVDLVGGLVLVVLILVDGDRLDWLVVGCLISNGGCWLVVALVQVVSWWVRLIGGLVVCCKVGVVRWHGWLSVLSGWLWPWSWWLVGGSG